MIQSCVARSRKHCIYCTGLWSCTGLLQHLVASVCCQVYIMLSRMFCGKHGAQSGAACMAVGAGTKAVEDCSLPAVATCDRLCVLAVTLTYPLASMEGRTQQCCYT